MVRVAEALAAERARPEYRPPTMAEVLEAEGSAGLVAASTFAGAGGSSMGYRLAGFKVAWANEFNELAAGAYRANFPGTRVDTRDIRTLSADDVLEAIGVGRGELDLLDGSPPCQSFSMAGKRQRGWGKVIDHADGTRQRSDDLFFDFIRLVEGVQPRAFVAENVAGLVRGVAKGYFAEVLGGLRGAGYRVRARVLDSQWLGVPQERKRVIIVGIREDLGREPAFPAPLPYRYSMLDALPWLRSDEGKRAGLVFIYGGWRDGWLKPAHLPSPTITAAGISGGTWHQCRVEAHGVQRQFEIREVKRLMSFPEDYQLVGGYGEQWARLGNAVPPLMAYRVGLAVRGVLES